MKVSKGKWHIYKKVKFAIRSGCRIPCLTLHYWHFNQPQPSVCLFSISALISPAFWIIFSYVWDGSSLCVYRLYTCATRKHIFHQGHSLQMCKPQSTLLSASPYFRHSFSTTWLILGVKCCKFCPWLQQKQFSFFCFPCPGLAKHKVCPTLPPRCITHDHLCINKSVKTKYHRAADTTGFFFKGNPVNQWV